MSVVAPYILDVNVCGVGLRRNAIVAHIDPGICDAEAVDIESVKTVRILGKVFVGGVRIEAALIKCYVVSPHHEGAPARAVQEFNAGNLDIGGIIREEQDWTVVLVVLVLSTFVSGISTPVE
jgi:hypothetical protein